MQKEKSVNFLAHAYLSFGHDELLVGNFIADKVKGNKYLDFPTGIQKGILLHRQIDNFTDKNLTVLKMVHLISHNHGRYAPIINDIFMDHFLAKNWDFYHKISLQNFVNNCLNILGNYEIFIPSYIQNFIDFVKKTNRLVEYKTLEGIELTLKQLSNKLINKPHLETAINDLKLHYVDLENYFHIYFPQLIDFCKSWISKNFPNLLIEN